MNKEAVFHHLADHIIGIHYRYHAHPGIFRADIRACSACDAGIMTCHRAFVPAADHRVHIDSYALRACRGAGPAADAPSFVPSRELLPFKALGI